MKTLTKKGIVVSTISVIVVTIIGVVAILRANSVPTLGKIASFTLEKIDDYSPDQAITFYDGNNHKIENPEVSTISLLDGTLLCEGPPYVVNKFELEGVNSLVIKTRNNEDVTIIRQ